MKMDAASIAQKAAGDPSFLIALIDNHQRALNSYNIEATASDIATIGDAMDKIKKCVANALADLGTELEGGSWGLGGVCCIGQA